MKSCSVEGCPNRYYAKGFCEKHYQRVSRHGTPLGDSTRTHASYEERFWRRVDKSGECWIWTGGSRTTGGYGLVQKGGKGSGYESAHRASFRMANGYSPQVVMHTCDNRLCVNPAHLMAGSHKENMADMVRKGRANRVGRKGEDHSRVKLTESNVRVIRALEGSGESASSIGRRYGVGHRAITAIWKRENWRHTP